MSDGCVFNVEAGDVDVTLHVWGPGGAPFGWGYYKHNEFKITPGTQYTETETPRNIQLVVNGKWYELKEVNYKYKYISIDKGGAVQITHRKWEHL